MNTDPNSSEDEDVDDFQRFELEVDVVVLEKTSSDSNFHDSANIFLYIPNKLEREEKCHLTSQKKTRRYQVTQKKVNWSCTRTNDHLFVVVGSGSHPHVP